MRDVEQAIIGTMIHDPAYRRVVLDSMQPDDFSMYRSVFERAQKQDQAGDFFTSSTLAKEGDYTRGDLDVLVGDALTCAEDVDMFIRLLKDDSTRRKLAQDALKLRKAMDDPSVDLSVVSGLLRGMEERINGTEERSALTPSEIFERESKRVKKEQLLTGVAKIDQGLYKDVGLHRGDINVILADSGHGKTQWSQYVAGLLAKRGYKGLWFQMEDYDVNTALALHRHAGDHADNVRICDNLDDIEDIRRQSFGTHYRDGLDFIVIDYVQEVYAQGKYDSRTLEINEITRVLKDIAKKLNVVVIVPSQVTISSYNRSGWQLEPKYSDAQWAQVIKNVAHCMTSVFRPNMVESLILEDAHGELRVKGFANGTDYPYNSVFVKLVKTRRGQITHDRLLVEHRLDHGLALPEQKWPTMQDQPF